MSFLNIFYNKIIPFSIIPKFYFSFIEAIWYEVVFYTLTCLIINICSIEGESKRQLTIYGLFELDIEGATLIFHGVRAKSYQTYFFPSIVFFIELVFPYFNFIGYFTNSLFIFISIL
nr:MAG TPA: hypothetical protein [Caudoviricetes sp.]